MLVVLLDAVLDFLESHEVLRDLLELEIDSQAPYRPGFANCSFERSCFGRFVSGKKLKSHRW